MKLKTLFTINAVISSVFGLSLLFVPAYVYQLYGQQLDLFAAATARMWGTAICGYAVLTWLVRGLPDSTARRRIVLALFIYFSIGLFGNIYNLVTVPSSPADWTTPLIYLFLASGYAYFHFSQNRSA